MISRYFQALAAGVSVAAVLAPLKSHATDAAVPRMAPVFHAPPLQQLQPAPQDPRWCYAGVHGGLMQLRYDVKTFSTPFGQHEPYSPVEDVKGTHYLPLIGAQIGCNYVQKNFLIGFEAETWIVPNTPPDCSINFDPIRSCVTIREKPAVAGSLRAGVIHGNFLFFGKVGLAYLNTNVITNFHRTVSVANVPTDGTPWQSDERHVRRGSLSQTGVLLGLGAEYMIDETWSAKVEVNKIITASSHKNFDAIIDSGGTVCSSNEPAAFPCNASPVVYRNTSGMIAKQAAKFGRGVFKIGVNKRF